MPYTNQSTIQASILIVDDMPDNLRLLSTLLKEQGYKVRSVINGSMALDAVQATPPPDLARRQNARHGRL